MENIHGQMVAQSGNLTQSGALTSQEYKYDAAGRLIEARDTAAGQCTVRQYEFSGTTGLDSNRTALKTYAPGTGGACNTSATPSTKSSNYDAADRLTNSGYQYDAFGRITTVPQADAGGSANMTASYYVNDLARNITEGTTTQTLELDPLQRMRTKTKVTGSTTSNESYAYTDDSDSPAWIATDATWTRNIEGLTGDAELYQTSAGTQRVLIADIRGDTVAEGSSSTANQVREVDEFGIVKNGLPTTRRYAFQGTKQREALTTGGTIAMGVRLYIPRVGIFLQSDPVVGGNDNPYGYPSDPINMGDLDGRAGNSFTLVSTQTIRYYNKYTTWTVSQTRTRKSRETRTEKRWDRKLVKYIRKAYAVIKTTFAIYECKKTTSTTYRVVKRTYRDKKGNAKTVVSNEVVESRTSGFFGCMLDSLVPGGVEPAY